MTEIPTFLGPYKVESVLGKGAMGTVYKAFDPNIQRTVAIKTIHASLLDEEDSTFLGYFKREAQAAGRLNHPNIVAIYGFSEHDLEPYLVMEYAPGQTLAQKLKAGRADVGESINIVLQILHGLQHAHSHKVVHRDIKPANVILNNGTAKVTDFGIAKIESTNLTMLGDVKGTPGYMSPEQWEGKTVDHRSDLFSTGVILYQLLTGDKPFSADTQANVLHRTLNVNPTPPSQLNPAVLSAFDGVVAKALAKEPAKRYQNAGEFLVALTKAQRQWSMQQDDKTVLPPPKPLIGQQASKGKKKLVKVGIVAGLLALVAGGFTTWKLNLLPKAATSQTTGVLVVDSVPQEVVVLLADKSFVGITPARVVLAAGKYQLVFRKDGFQDYEQQVEIPPEQELAVTAMLQVKNKL